MSKTSLIVLLVMCFSLTLLPPYASAWEADADGQRASINFGKAPLATPSVKAVKLATSTNSTVVSTSLHETLAKDVTVAPRDSAVFEWAADLSGAERVAISITTLNDPDSRLTNVRLGVGFAAPGDWFILSDVIRCNTFFFYDHGGVTVPVYGPFMKVGVFNDGTTPLKITQLSVYAVAR